MLEKDKEGKQMKKIFNTISIFLMKLMIVTALVLLTTVPVVSAEASKKTQAPFTLQDPMIPLDAFELKIAPMTSDELFVEADGWLKILQDAATKVYVKKLEILELNKMIKSQKDLNTSSQDQEAENAKKVKLSNELTTFRNDRHDKEVKLNAILKEINERIGLDDKGQELAKIKPYRRYISSVSGISQEVTDPRSLLKSIRRWFTAQDGGILWLMNLIKFTLIIFLALLLSKLISNGVQKALTLSKSSSRLLNTFIVNIVYKVVMLLGVLMGLSVLGVNMGPVLAVIGAAGFVVAFALQSTLSNFASGLMIMLYRPFDIDDVVDVAGVIGTVNSMTMVTTSIMTADNRLMVIPNNTIWGSIITNVTHSDKRRVDMTFGIGYSDNIEKVQKVLEDVLSGHPLILKDPKPTVQVHELADSSVNFIVRPWTLTADYWTVYWEVTRRVKISFDEEGISIPFPQRDIHIITSSEEEEGDQKRAFTKKHAKEIDISEMDVPEENL